MENCYIGIDTSNYTTSVSVCGTDGSVLANLKKLLPVAEGERGLRQSDAVFSHVRNLPLLADDLRTVLRGKRVLAVGVSRTPRDAEGSYMPCFLSGCATAEILAAALDCPLYGFSHQAGHVMAAAYSSGRAEYLMSAPFLAFHVSGGTTEALRVTKDPDMPCGLSIKLVGKTADISAGQAIDRVGVLMGMRFPCGPELERCAAGYDPEKTKMPPLRTCVRDGVCNLSGLENMAGKLYESTGDRALTSAFTLRFIEKTLSEMTRYLLASYPDSPILFAGGVMSNRMIRSGLSRLGDVLFAEPAFAADNAAGIALLTKRRYEAETGSASSAKESV